MLIQLAFLIGFFIISFIPIVGWLISFVGNFLVASYFYGFAFIDYTNERNRLSLKQSIQFVRTNKWFAIGIGTIFALCFMVPLIGGIIASFACIVSVVAATIKFGICCNCQIFVRKFPRYHQIFMKFCKLILKILQIRFCGFLDSMMI